MTLTIDGTDLTDRLIDAGTEVGADINDVFGTMAKTKQYALRDYDDYLNPYAPEGLFALVPYRGREVIEKDDAGIIRFHGTIQNVEETDAQECIVYAAEPLTIFLDWPVEASDRETHAGFLVNGDVASGQTLAIDGGVTTIPNGAVVYFNDSKVPSYMVTAHSPSSGATTSITIDRPLAAQIDDNSAITVAVPALTTGPTALKNALLTSNPEILLDGTFDILGASDAAAGYQIIVNVMEQDNIALRDYLPVIREMTDLILTQKNDGYYTLRRGLEWNGQPINDNLTGDEIITVDPKDDDSQLIIGHDLLYKSSDNVAALLQADVDPALVRKYRGIKFWQPAKTAQSFAQIKYMYASVSSAQYFGARRLAYYSKPRTVIHVTAKPAYNNDPNRALDIYLGKQFTVNVRRFVNVKAIVVGFLYSEERQQYTRLALQLNEQPILITNSVANYLITDDGDFIVSGDGNFIVVG